jgi:hypothetical protein
MVYEILSSKNPSQKRSGTVAQGVGPELQLQVINGLTQYSLHLCPLGYNLVPISLKIQSPLQGVCNGSQPVKVLEASRKNRQKHQ